MSWYPYGHCSLFCVSGLLFNLAFFSLSLLCSFVHSQFLCWKWKCTKLYSGWSWDGSPRHKLMLNSSPVPTPYPRAVDSNLAPKSRFQSFVPVSNCPSTDPVPMPSFYLAMCFCRMLQASSWTQPSSYYMNWHGVVEGLSGPPLKLLELHLRGGFITVTYNRCINMFPWDFFFLLWMFVVHSSLPVYFLFW